VRSVALDEDDLVAAGSEGSDQRECHSSSPSRSLILGSPRFGSNSELKQRIFRFSSFQMVIGAR